MRLTAPGIVAILTVLSGCATDGVMIGGTQYASFYDPYFIRYGTRGGEIPIVVRGAPFGDPTHDPAEVVAAMSAPPWLGSVRFVPAAATGNASSYRVILSFGSTTENDPCVAAPTTPGGQGGAASVQASFCAGTQLISSLTASSAPAKSASDPQFHHFMDEVVVNLIPVTNPMQSKGGGGGL